ncbi:MAG: metal ABC transporter ATP-binding protein [Muribaculaceae bacterium]
MHLPQQKIIELQQVSLTYSNHRTALSDVNMQVDEGDFIAITGPNGGGKTTLLRLILRLIAPTSGQITYHWHGNEVKQLNIGYLPQKNSIDSRFPITVEEVVASGLQSNKHWFMPSRNANKQIISQTLEKVGLEDVRNCSIGQISGGQLQRALLGRAIISPRQVLVLDEPLSYIDKQFEPRLYQIIDEIAKNTTVILVSHEMNTISQMANKHIIVQGTVHQCHAAHHYVPTQCQ